MANLSAHAVDLWRCFSPTCASAPPFKKGQHTHGSLILTTHFDRLISRSWESAYGHLFHSVELFFACVVGERMRCLQESQGCMAPFRHHDELVVRVPAWYNSTDAREKPFELFSELQQLFSGGAAKLRIERAPWVVACSGRTVGAAARWQYTGQTVGGCCSSHEVHDRATREPLLQLEMRAGGAFSAQPWTWLKPRMSRGAFLRRMRAAVWATAGASAQPRPDTVTFVSTQSATNNRRVADEEKLARAVKRRLAERLPGVAFRHERLEDLSLLDEVRLMARSRMLIGLYGSALHNCRFLPDEAVVVEIHGALKNDIGHEDWYKYFELCQGVLGLRWVGVAASNAMNNVIAETEKGSDEEAYAVARLNATTLVDAIDRVLAEDWQGLARDFVRAEHRATRALLKHPGFGAAARPDWMRPNSGVTEERAEEKAVAQIVNDHPS